MNCLKRFLVAIVMTIIICGTYSTVVYAEDISSASVDTNTSQAGQSEELLGDGYSVDEDGNIYVDNSALADSSDDTAIDVTDSDVDDTEDSAVTDDVDAQTQEDAEGDDEDAEPSYSKSDLRYLSCLIYAEAGNQSYNAMLGVANVVLNRVDSDVFWHVKTIKDVIYDRKWSVQFAVTIKNSKGISPMDRALKAYDTGKFNSGNPDAEQKAMDKAIKAAKAALNGKNNIGSYLCFSNKSYKSYVKRHYSKYEIIDDTIFFRTK